jgi:hypothetical protein
VFCIQLKQNYSYARDQSRVLRSAGAEGVGNASRDQFLDLRLSADDTNAACEEAAISACRRFVSSSRASHRLPVFFICGGRDQTTRTRRYLNCSEIAKLLD